MSDQEKMNPESVSPEYVSLEERFARRQSENGVQVEQDVANEGAQEKNSGEKNGVYSAILSKVQTTSSIDNDTVIHDASMLDQKTDRESQITHLIDLATTKGIAHAVTVAQKAEDYYILDQLHDRLLADDLHDALMSRGLIE